QRKHTASPNSHLAPRWTYVSWRRTQVSLSRCLVENVPFLWCGLRWPIIGIPFFFTTGKEGAFYGLDCASLSESSTGLRLTSSTTLAASTGCRPHRRVVSRPDFGSVWTLLRVKRSSNPRG